MKNLFEEYGMMILAAICGSAILSVFTNVMFGSNSSSLKMILESWVHRLV